MDSSKLSISTNCTQPPTRASASRKCRKQSQGLPLSGWRSWAAPSVSRSSTNSSANSAAHGGRKRALSGSCIPAMAASTGHSVNNPQDELPPPGTASLADSIEAADLPHHYPGSRREEILDHTQLPKSARKAINELLISASTLPELQAILESQASRMDGVNASHALYRLAKLVNLYSCTMDAAGVPLAEAMPAAWDSCVAPCLSMLSTMLTSCLGELEARDVASSLWACTAIGHYDRTLFDTLCNKAVALLPEMKPVDCANIMVAFARFGHYHPEVIRMIPQVLLEQIYETKPHELSQILWGYGRLRVPGAPGKVFLEAATDALSSSMDQFGPQELSNMLWAFVKLHHYPGRSVLLRSETLTLRRLVSSRSRFIPATRASNATAAHTGTASPSLPRQAPTTHPQQPPFSQTPQHLPSPVLSPHSHFGGTSVSTAEQPHLQQSGSGLATSSNSTTTTAINAGADVRSITDNSNSSSSSSSSSSSATSFGSSPQSPQSSHTQEAGISSSNGTPHLHSVSQPNSTLAPPLPARLSVGAAGTQASLSSPYAMNRVSSSTSSSTSTTASPNAITGAHLSQSGLHPISGAQRGGGDMLPAASYPLQPLAPQDVGNLLWAYGKLRFKGARLLDELPLYLGSWLHEFRIPDLCCLLAGYTNARHYHRGVLEALAPLLMARIHTLNVSELVIVLWSYGIFQHRPLSEPHLLDAVSAALVGQLRPGTYTQTYSLIIKAYANLRYWPESVLSKMVENAEARINSFRPDEMANLLYGLSHLAAGKHIHQREERRLALQAAASSPSSGNSGNGTRSNGNAAASTASANLPTPVIEDISPVLSPPLVQLFHSFMRQCMRIMDDAEFDENAPRLNYKVLNSIVFSCLRVGQSPWMLIDYAESRGIRLIQPGVAMAKLNLEREIIARAAVEALTGSAPGPSHLTGIEAEAVKIKKKARGGKQRRQFKKRLAAESEEERQAAAAEEAAAAAAEESATASVALAGQAAAASRAEGANVPPPRAHVTLPGEAVSGHWLSASGRSGSGRLSHRRGPSRRHVQSHDAGFSAGRETSSSQTFASAAGAGVAASAAATGTVPRAHTLFGSLDEEDGGRGAERADRQWFSRFVADGGELVPKAADSSNSSSSSSSSVSGTTQQTEDRALPGADREGHERGVGVSTQGARQPEIPQQHSEQPGAEGPRQQQRQRQESQSWPLDGICQPPLEFDGSSNTAPPSKGPISISSQGPESASPHVSQQPCQSDTPHSHSLHSVHTSTPLAGASASGSSSSSSSTLNKARRSRSSSSASVLDMRAELGADNPLPSPSFSSPSLLARPIATSSRDEDAAPSATSSRDEDAAPSASSSRDEDAAQ